MELLKFCIGNYSFTSQFAFRKIWFGNQLVIIWRRKTDYVLGLNEAHIKPNSRFEMLIQTNFRHINSYADQLFWNLRLMPLMQPNRGVGIVKIIGSHLFQLNSSFRTFFHHLLRVPVLICHDRVDYFVHIWGNMSNVPHMDSRRLWIYSLYVLLQD